ncbi:beta-1,3-galactosyltransferase 5 isoform X2 [Lepeophtheirus salmonis]|nr:beta-1,3-galactosyltransferase 5-like isoform X1 [Lepeophtheirus salmonis]
MVKTGIKSLKSPLWVFLCLVLIVTVYISGKSIGEVFVSYTQGEISSELQSIDYGTVLTSDLFVENWILEGSHVACRDKKLLTILVISAPDHFDHRRAIRSTWGGISSAREDITFAFIIGSSLDPSIHEEILSEDSEFQDIIMYGMEDLYENLSMKTIHGLKWIEKFCPNNDFFLKIDDDMFLQIPRLIGFIRGYQRSGSKEPVIFGKLAEGWPPVHNPNSKYYIRPSAYTGSTYPGFVTGPSYLMNQEAIKRLLSNVMALPYIHLEDVFITGVTAEKSNVTRKHIQEFRNNGTPIPPKFIGCTLLRTITIHKVKPEEQMDYLKVAQRPQCGQKTQKKVTITRVDPKVQ